jgi:adenylyltransferase/sulfurtransferase
VAAFQSAQVLKLLIGQRPAAEMVQIDVWNNSARLVDVSGARNVECPCCGKRDFRFLRGQEKERLIRLCGRNAVQVHPRQRTRLDFAQLSERLKRSGKVTFNEYMMRILINGYEIALFPDGRSIIKGTEDFTEARAVYAKYIGS